METKITFEEYLRKENLSENTITSYLWTVNYFNVNYDVVSKENLLAYKGYLMEFFKPKTVNLRIQAINKYLEYLEEHTVESCKGAAKKLLRECYQQCRLQFS
jgi:hypothetical protein